MFLVTGAAGVFGVAHVSYQGFNLDHWLEDIENKPNNTHIP